MISTETINIKIQMPPVSARKEVIDFIDDLLEKSAKSNQTEKASAWEDRTQNHSNNAAVINDNRKAIYV